ncbi:MAG: hypothetical protein MJ238_05335 [Bacilli bacterium]|nr:hypothetical protein [Bacilli bacterium]
MITTPIGDAIKVFAEKKKKKNAEFFKGLSEKGTRFYILYLIFKFAPFACFGLFSFAVVSFFLKTYTPKVKNNIVWFFISIKQFFLSFKPVAALYRKIFKHDPFLRSRVYIFTEAGVDTAVTLAENLSKKRYGKNKYGDKVVTRKGDIVTIVVPSSSMRTQEGTEFRDKLILKGFDVITENVSYRFLAYFLRRKPMIFKSRKRLTRTVAYSMFYNDKDNVAFAKRAYDVIYAVKEKTAWHAFLMYLLKLCHYVGIARPKNPPELVGDNLNEHDSEANVEEQERNEQIKRRQDQKKRKADRRKYRVMTFARIIDVLKNLDKDIEIVEKSGIEGKTEKQIAKAKNKLIKKGRRYFNVLDRVQFYISCQDYDYDDAYPFIKESFGMIKSFSEYEAVSTDFLLHTPITTFLPDLREKARKPIDGPMYDKPMNVHFIGFGRINRAIFTKMTAAYQLCRDGEDLIHYHIVDKDADSLIKDNSNIYHEPSNPSISLDLSGDITLEKEKKAILKKLAELLGCNEEDKKLAGGLEKANKTLEYVFENKDTIVDLKQTIRGIFYSALCELKPDEYIYAGYPKLFDVSGHLDGLDLTEDETLISYIKKEFDNKKDGVHILNKSEFNAFIVSVGDAELNIKIAHTLRAAINAYSTGERKTYIYAFANNGNVVREELEDKNNIVVKIEDQDPYIKDEMVRTPIILFGSDEVLADYQIQISAMLDKFGCWENFMYGKTRRKDSRLNDEEELLSKISWKKGNTVKNQASNIYSSLTLNAKLSLAGYDLSNDLEISPAPAPTSQIDLQKIVMKTPEFITNKNVSEEEKIVRDNIMRMEHSRFVLQKAFIEKMLPLPITTFLKNSTESQSGQTKGQNNTRHACIVSNNDLRMFEGVLLYAGIREIEESKFEYNFKDMHKTAIKLIYDNDLDGIAAAIAFSKK